MKKLFLTLLALVALPVLGMADETAQPVPVPTQVQDVAPKSNLAPAYLFIPTKPADTVVPFFDVAKCDAAVKAMAPAYKGACVHTQ